MSLFELKNDELCQNILTTLLVLLFVSLVGGDYFLNFKLFGFEIYGFRIVLLVSFFFLWWSKNLVLFNTKFSRYVFYGFIIWIAYGSLSILWVENANFAFKEIYYCAIGIVGYIVLFSFKEKIHDFTSRFELAWLLGYLFVLVVASFELLTKKHLNGEYIEKLNGLGFYHDLNAVPVTFFHNPNTFANYLCLSVAISTFYLFKERRLILHLSIILSSIFLIYLTESRLSLIFISLCVLGIFLLHWRNLREVMNKRPYRKRSFWLALGLLTLLIASVIGFDHSANSKKNEENYDTRIGHIILESVDAAKLEKNKEPDKVFLTTRSFKEKLLKNETLEIKLISIKDLQPFESKLFTMLKFGFVLLLFIGLVLSICIFGFLGMLKDKSNLAILGILFLIAGFFASVFYKNQFDHGDSDFENLVIVEHSQVISAADQWDLISVSSSLIQKIKQDTNVMVRKKDITSEVAGPVLNSNMVRKNLILNGMDFLVESKFLGIGAGAYREFNLQKKGKRDIGTVIEAHNFVVEILVQYGILIFALGLGIFGWILLKLFQSFFKKHWSLQHTLVLFLFFCIITTGNSNSTYIPLPTNWIILILFLIHSNELMKLESENAQF